MEQCRTESFLLLSSKSRKKKPGVLSKKTPPTPPLPSSGHTSSITLEVTMNIGTHFVGSWKPIDIAEWFLDSSFSSVAHELHDEFCHFSMHINADGKGVIHLGKLAQAQMQLSQNRRGKSMLSGILTISNPASLPHQNRTGTMTIEYNKKNEVRLHYSMSDTTARTGLMIWEKKA